MNKKFKKERLLGKDFKRPILFVVVFFIIYLILATALITKKYDLKVGDIPKADIKANKEIIDQSATNAKKKYGSRKSRQKV